MVWPLIDILVTEVQSLPAYNNILDQCELGLTSPASSKSEMIIMGLEKQIFCNNQHKHKHRLVTNNLTMIVRERWWPK